LAKTTQVRVNEALSFHNVPRSQNIQRKPQSNTELNELYFWTSTVNKWQHLLAGDENKMIIMDSLRWLVRGELVRIYGYVIMPNHIHLLWEQLKMNGNELPKTSFQKYTSRLLVKIIMAANDPAKDRLKNIWQRDPLAVRIECLKTLTQKLDYMHLNPLQPRWLLSENPADYTYSSAAYYENNRDPFSILTHFGELYK
jgi:putative transposase